MYITKDPYKDFSATPADFFCFYVGRRLARGFSLRRALSDFRTFNTYYNDSLVLKDFNRVL